MGLRYYDPIDSRLRIKRRYVWSFWSFWAGMLVGGIVLYGVVTLN